MQQVIIIQSGYGIKNDGQLLVKRAEIRLKGRTLRTIKVVNQLPLSPPIHHISCDYKLNINKAMKQDIENIIKKNLPEKRELKECGKCNSCEMMMSCEVLYADRQFNQALSQINTSLIADEVLKVVVEKIEKISDFADSGDTLKSRIINLIKNN